MKDFNEKVDIAVRKCAKKYLELPKMKQWPILFIFGFGLLLLLTLLLFEATLQKSAMFSLITSAIASFIGVFMPPKL